MKALTGIFDWMCMYIFVDVLGLHDVFIKIISNILAIILNFSASKELYANNLNQLRWIFFRECCSIIRRIAGCVTDF